MKRALTFPLAIVALVGGCSSDPAPGNPYASASGTLSTAASGTTDASTTAAASVTDGGTAGPVGTGNGTASVTGNAVSGAGTSTTGGLGTVGGTGVDTNGISGATTLGTSTSTSGTPITSSTAASNTAGVGGATSTGTTATTAATTGTTVPPAGSSGCGLAATQATGQWVSQPGDREWAIYLPNNYDPTRAYPLVVQLHGCTGGTNNVPVERESGDNAIHVRGTGSAANICWDTSSNSPDIQLFDDMVAGVKAAACVDENRVFASGYSSGSWLVSLLACIRGDVLRAAGTVAGGNALPGNAQCTGTIAQIFIHDLDDTENYWQQGNGGHITAMNRLLDVNGCTPDSAVAEDPAPCERYQGCGENPIKVCNTMGQGHNRQDNFAAPAFWQFFSEF